MAKKHKKTIYKFRQDVEKRDGVNSVQGFWFSFYYRKYALDLITYDDAVATLRRMGGYTGV